MPVAPRHVSQDRPATVLMIRLVGVGEGKVSDAREDRFDPIQPRRIGGGEHQLDVMHGGPLGDLASFVGREVVEDEVEARGPWVLCADGLQEQQNFAPPLAAVAPHHEAIVLQVVGRQVLTRPVEPPVGRANPDRVPDGSPCAPMRRANFDRSEFVETDHAGVRRRSRTYRHTWPTLALTFVRIGYEVRLKYTVFFATRY